jgi:hypothetical protein
MFRNHQLRIVPLAFVAMAATLLSLPAPAADVPAQLPDPDGKPMTNLVNSRGVPLATQRSDDWLPEETPIKFLLPPGATMKTHGRWIRDRINKELGFADTQRQIQEAEATIARLKEEYAEDKEAWEKQKATERKRAEDAWKGAQR